MGVTIPIFKIPIKNAAMSSGKPGGQYVAPARRVKHGGLRKPAPRIYPFSPAITKRTTSVRL